MVAALCYATIFPLLLALCVNRRIKLKRKILIIGGIFVGWVLAIVIGMYSSFYFMTGLELNDRLKYEAAYLKGYIAVQNQLYEGDIEKAKQSVDLLIDAHAMTISEFSFLSSTAISYDIQEVLCRAVQLRKNHPRVPSNAGEGEAEAQSKIDSWYQEIDESLAETGVQC